MRIRFYDIEGMFLDEFISTSEYVNLSGTCLLHKTLYEIIDVKPFIKQKDSGCTQEYIKVIAKILN